MGMVGMTLTSAEQTTVGLECLWVSISTIFLPTTLQQQKVPAPNYRPLKESCMALVSLLVNAYENVSSTALQPLVLQSRERQKSIAFWDSRDCEERSHVSFPSHISLFSLYYLTVP